MVGASGAISGVLGAYLLLYPHARVLVVIPLGFYLHRCACRRGSCWCCGSACSCSAARWRRPVREAWRSARTSAASSRE